MLGLGRNSLVLVLTLTNRETIDINALELQELKEPVIICASACTVNTGDFDDILEIVKTKRKI